MAKKVTGFLKLQVPAGAANPAPPIGPAPGQRQRRHRDQGSGQGNRRSENERLELQHSRRGHAHGRRLRPFDGPSGEGISTMATGKRMKAVREGVDPAKAYPLDEAVKMVK